MAKKYLDFKFSEFITNKNFSFSAGQYFDFKIEKIEITPEEFKAKIDQYSDELNELFKVIEEIFAQNWGYNKISKEYFFNLFFIKNNVKPKMFLHTVHLNQKLIGFCSYIENDVNTLIFKTIGILPDYQKMGSNFSGFAFQASLDLAIKGASQPSGYTEPLLHKWRLESKKNTP